MLLKWNLLLNSILKWHQLLHCCAFWTRMTGRPRGCPGWSVLAGGRVCHLYGHLNGNEIKRKMCQLPVAIWQLLFVQLPCNWSMRLVFQQMFLVSHFGISYTQTQTDTHTHAHTHLWLFINFNLGHSKCNMHSAVEEVLLLVFHLQKVKHNKITHMLPTHTHTHPETSTHTYEYYLWLYTR